MQMYLGLVTLWLLFSSHSSGKGKMLTPAQTHTNSLSTPSIHRNFPSHLPLNSIPLLGPSQHLYVFNYLQAQTELTERKAALHEVETALDILINTARLLVWSCHWQAKISLFRSWCNGGRHNWPMEIGCIYLVGMF